VRAGRAWSHLEVVVVFVHANAACTSRARRGTP
jgi:hypothetical protein